MNIKKFYDLKTIATKYQINNDLNLSNYNLNKNSKKFRNLLYKSNLNNRSKKSSNSSKKKFCSKSVKCFLRASNFNLNNINNSNELPKESKKSFNNNVNINHENYFNCNKLINEKYTYYNEYLLCNKSYNTNINSFNCCNIIKEENKNLKHNIKNALNINKELALRCKYLEDISKKFVYLDNYCKIINNALCNCLQLNNKKNNYINKEDIYINKNYLRYINSLLSLIINSDNKLIKLNSVFEDFFNLFYNYDSESNSCYNNTSYCNSLADYKFNNKKLIKENTCKYKDNKSFIKSDKENTYFMSNKYNNRLFIIQTTNFSYITLNKTKEDTNTLLKKKQNYILQNTRLKIDKSYNNILHSFKFLSICYESKINIVSNKKKNINLEFLDNYILNNEFEYNRNKHNNTNNSDYIKKIMCINNNKYKLYEINNIKKAIIKLKSKFTLLKNSILLIFSSSIFKDLLNFKILINENFKSINMRINDYNKKINNKYNQIFQLLNKKLDRYKFIIRENSFNLIKLKSDFSNYKSIHNKKNSLT